MPALICSVTMVYLPHTTIATSSSFGHCQTEARPHPSCCCSPPVAVEADESVARLTAGSRQILLVSSVAPRPFDFGDNDEHEDREQTYVQLPVYREMEMELSITTKTKNLQHKSCVKRCAEATHERKFKQWTVCDEFDKFVQNTFKQN
jgi:hypothetical protein